jgi:predicted acylesterase/phospholipase RssA
MKADGNIFDIVAGASAGAINASIIVGHIMADKKKNKNKGKLKDGKAQ